MHKSLLFKSWTNYTRYGLVFYIILVAHYNSVFDYYNIHTSFLLGLMGLLLCLVTKCFPLLHTALVFLIFPGIFLFLPKEVWSIPTAPYLLSIFLSAPIALKFSSFSYLFDWAKKGNPTVGQWMTGALISFGSGIALILWAYWSNNLSSGTQIMKELSDNHSSYLILLILIPLFALVNAFSEEFIYRGIIQEGFQKILPNPPLVSIFLSALTFAATHVQHGFPNGKLGYLMTLIYGVLLGILRIKTKGILLPYVIHVTSDLTIGYLLWFLMN